VAQKGGTAMSTTCTQRRCGPPRGYACPSNHPGVESLWVTVHDEQRGERTYCRVCDRLKHRRQSERRKIQRRARKAERCQQSNRVEDHSRCDIDTYLCPECMALWTEVSRGAV